MFIIQEKRIFIYSVIILLFLITFIQLIGYFLADESYYYTTAQPTRQGDIYQHFSFIIQAKDGQWLFKNLFNPDKNQRALFFHPLWLAIGITAKIFNLSIPLVYQLFKVMLAIIFCLVLKKFLEEFFELKRQLWLLPFCLFSGGFATWLIEKDTLLNLYYSPLFILSLILFLLVYWAVLKFFQNHSPYLLTVIFSLSLLLFLTHFYDTASLLVVILAWSGYQYLTTKRLKDWLPGLMVFIGVGLGALYYLYIFFKEPSLNIWALNNVTLLPSWRFLALGYGALGPLAILGAVKKFRQPAYLFLILWILAGLFIIFSPIPFNRRFVLGLSIPLAILAYQGFIFLISRFKVLLGRQVAALIFIFSLSGSSLFLIAFDLEVIKWQGRPQYEKRSQIEALMWMRDNLPKNKIVFANFQYWDTIISGYTGMLSLAGGYLTSFSENLDKIYWFFKDNQDSLARKQFLIENDIDYLFYSEVEKRLGNFQPRDQDYLKLIYKNQDAEVYQVINPPATASP